MEDIIIIGGGPVGIYASILASLHSLKGFLIESLDTLGGQLTSLYPEKKIIDLPGFTSISAKEYINALIKQRESLTNKFPLHLNEKFESFTKIDNGYSLKTNKGIYETKTILIATGMGVFTPRQTGIKNENQFDNIIYSLKSLDSYKNKTIAVLGGGDSALDWAIMLADIAKKVYIIHRRDEFRGQSSSVQVMIDKGVEVLKPYLLQEFIGDSSLKSIVLKHAVSNEIKTIDVDMVFVNYGIITSPINIDLELTNSSIKVDSTYMTSKENIFAIGNAINYPGKVKNITAGLGEAVIAITKIDQIINPNKNIPIHF